VLGLAPGSLECAAVFRVEGAPVGFTICRDTFMDEWDSHFDELLLWIDVKANGVAYDARQRANFRKALPERIAQSGVPYGLTVCLTGSFLDLFWEGRSSFIARSEGTTVPLVTAASHDEQELLRLSVPYGG
jgi:predicted amidohydrolase